MSARVLHRLAAVVLSVSVSCFLFSCGSDSKPGLFEQLSAAKTGISFTNKLEKHKLFNILYYLYYYNGAGVATGDINNDGLPDIYFTANNKGGNKLYLNKGNFQFEDITTKAGVAGLSDWCTGVTMADVNGDGFLDIYVSTISQKYDLKGHNELYINNGNLTFTESSAKYGLNTSCLSTQAAFFDYDHDGDLDCYILNQSHHPHANIVDTSLRRNYDSLSGDRLYRNDIATTGKFTDVSAQAGIYQSNLGYGLGLAVADINNDGWDDIYIGNDFHENDYYYINNGNGTFTESGAKHFLHYSRFSMGNDVNDFNNDGQPDVITVDMLPPDEKVLKTYGSDENPDIYKVKIDLRGYQKQYSRNCLQRNNGNGDNFSDIALQSGVAATDWSWSPLFADFDNDGNKDLFISSGIVKRPVDLDYIRFITDLDMRKGRQQTDKYDDEAINSMPDGASHPFFFKGDGDMKFTDVSGAWGTGKMKGYFTGSSYADLDRDGNVDVIINCIDAPAVILKNNAPRKHTMNITFKGEGMNTTGIGTKVWMFYKDMKGKRHMQYQQLSTTRGFQSSVEPKLHFGLDSLHSIDSILVVWPTQKYQLFINTPPIGRLEALQINAGQDFEYKKFFPAQPDPYTDVTTNTGITWKHKEDDFLDYNQQYLIPHMESTRGPKVAVGDVNKDGLSDFYVCGASGQPGQLMIQTAAGRFVSSSTAVFGKAARSDEVDALFFDANNDSWPDLYVVTGGNVAKDGDSVLADHLYINNGKGGFTPSGAIPALLKNKSCVSSADVDKDGDADLFIGGLADAARYGIPQSSWLLLNDGKGSFQPAASSMIRLDSLGIVTSSSFADINNDGWPDLIVSGEWMPMKIFMNNKGSFTEKDVPGSTGLWQTICTADVNGDGFTDILAGNWGHNTKLWAGKNGPVKLFVKDFDRNGSIEQVMTCSMNGKDYTFLAKDELERSLPVLKKAYLKYSDVAGKTVDYMFYDLFNNYRTLQAETLSSSCFINDGKGGFKRIDLPDELQMAPVMSFCIGQQPGELIAGGNFYGVIPYEGRYDALLPTQFAFNKSTGEFEVRNIIKNGEGEIRDIRWLTGKGGKPVLVLARNNDTMIFLQPMK